MSPLNGRHAESVRERFQAALLTAESTHTRPRIDDYLRDLQEPERSAVFCSLLALELRYRMEHGENPSLEEYLHQFPDAASHVQSVFRETGSRDPAPTSSFAGQAPLTKEEAPQSPTVSYFPGGGVPVGTTDGHLPAYGPAPSPAHSTEQLARRQRRRAGRARLPNVPGYEIIEVVGRGGMGIVYKARDVNLQILVALKMIDPERDHAPGPQDLDVMLKEAQAVAQLGHPNVVHIYTIGKHNGHPFLSLEFLEGGNLSKKLRATPQPANTAAAWIETLARTIDHAHQKQIVHRDLKPSNILLAADGTPKITDFGLAMRLDQNAGQVDDGYIVGTVIYMAPEQAWGKNKEVGKSADIYSLGVILYEMLTGRPPFKARNRWDTVQMVRSAEPVPPSHLVPQVPLDLELICLKCLKKDPKDRFASAAELAEELRAFQEGRPIKTRPTPIWERAWKWAKRKPAVASLIAATFVVSVIALASVVLHLDQRAREAERELREQQRVRAQRDDVQKKHREAQQLADRGLPKEAQIQLDAAFYIVGSEPLLTDLKPGLELLQEKVERQARVLRSQQSADDVYKQFFQYRDEALFNGMVLGDMAVNVKATRDACNKAEALITNAEGAPHFPEYMSLARQKECKAACYELLLVRAGVEAEAARVEPADPVNEPGRFINRALLFHRPTQAYHLRRAALMQDKAAADAQRQLAAEMKPDGALDYFLAGDLHLKHRRLKEAADDFALAVRDEPNHFWAWYMLGMCNLQRNKMDLARQNFTTCLGYRKDLWWPYMSRGLVNSQIGDFDAAHADYRQALALNPDRQGAYGIIYNQGDLCVKQSRLADGLMPMPWPAPFAPNLEFARRGAADMYRKERLAAAERFLDDARAIHKDGYHPYLYLAQVRQQQNRLAEAEELLGEAIAKAEKREGLKPLVKAYLYGQRARLLRQREKLDAALADLDVAVKLEPSAEDHAERGRILVAQKEPELALKAFDAALKLRPGEAEIYRYKADTLRLLKKHDEAAQALEQYLARTARPAPESYRLLGALRAKQGDSPAALKAYSQAIDLQPDAASFTARAWVFLANESVPLALDDFEMALARDSKNAEAYAGRGLIRARQGKHNDALADAELALTYGGANPPARLLWNVAHVYAKIAVDPRIKGANRDLYENRAVSMLDRALKQMPREERVDFWKEYVDRDPLLIVPLRGNVAFESMENLYGQKKR